MNVPGGKAFQAMEQQAQGPVSLTFQGAERWSTLLARTEEIPEIRVKVKM